MFPTAPTSVTTVAQIIQLAVAPVFLFAGIGAFLNVCAGRLSRIVDRARNVEPMLLASRGAEHDRWLARDPHSRPAHGAGQPGNLPVGAGGGADLRRRHPALRRQS